MSNMWFTVLESFIIYVKVFTYVVGHPEEFYQQTYIIKTPTNVKSKEERIHSIFAANLPTFEYTYSHKERNLKTTRKGVSDFRK